MKNEPISSRDLEQARECRLMEPDGTCWEVLDVTVDDGRAWVRARRPPNGKNGSEAGGEERDGPPGQLRIFDTVLSRSARLIWELPDGRQVQAKGAVDGDLQWSVKSGVGPSGNAPAGEANGGRRSEPSRPNGRGGGNGSSRERGSSAGAESPDASQGEGDYSFFQDSFLAS